MYSTASWDVTPCSLVRGHRCFREIATFIFRVADYAGRLKPVQDIEKVWMGLGDSNLTEGGSNTLQNKKQCTLCVHCFLFFTLAAGLLARSQYSEGPATRHLDTGFMFCLHVK